jgi:cytochrome P450
MQEMVLVHATIAQRFRLESLTAQHIQTRPAVTLRPAEPIRLTVRFRASRSELEGW